MASTQKLFMMIMTLGIVTGIVNGILPEENTVPEADEETNSYMSTAGLVDDYWEEYNKNSTKLGTIDQQDVIDVDSIGNPRRMGLNIWDLLLDIANPLSSIREANFRESNSNTELVENWLRVGITILRSLLYLMLMIQLYQFFINKKTD